METTFPHRPVYSVLDNGIDLSLREVVPFLGSQPYRHRAVTLAELVATYRRAKERNSGSAIFYLAALVVLGGEHESRRAIQLKTNSKLRSVKLCVKNAAAYAQHAVNRCIKQRHNKKGGETMNEDIAQAMSDIYAPVKRLLGLAQGNPVEYSYPVTDSVIAQAANPDCRLYLEALASDGPVYTWQLDRIINEIRRDYTDDSNLVIQQLVAGQNQDHLSAISLHGVGHKLRITVVNPAGIKLSMAALRFEMMVHENGGTKLLGHLGERDPETGGAVVTLSTPISKGRVVGWYNGETSTLHVSCLRDKDGGVDFTTTFALDSNMVVSHYEVLRRLHEDRERFQRLLDASDSFLEVDPFRQLKREKERPNE